MKIGLSLIVKNGVYILSYLFATSVIRETHTSAIAQAQVIPDNTVNTQVEQIDGVAEITGGATREDNLFHSFQEFSIPTGNEAFFNNADSINNIFSRVTGGTISNIDGVIKANGTANLFLINPAGIIFAEGATLNIGGSFYASTAESIVFPNEIEFSTKDTSTKPLLTVNAPIGLSLDDNPGDIEVKSKLNANRNEIPNIALIGGEVSINGGNITNFGGNINLGGLASSGKVYLKEDNTLTFPDNVTQADVSTSNNAFLGIFRSKGKSIKINGNNLNFTERSHIILGTENNINIQAKNNILINNSLFITEAGNDEQGNAGDAGDISIFSGEKITLENKSTVLSQLKGEAQGNTGNITIVSGEKITLANNSTVNSVIKTNAKGNAGNINLKSNFLELKNNSGIQANTDGFGNAGNVAIDVDSNISLDNGAFFLAQSKSNAIGDAGDIVINAGDSLLLTKGSFVLTDAQNQENSGNITINAGKTILLEGISDKENLRSQIVSQVGFDGIGEAGDILINAQELLMDDVAFISSSSSLTTKNSLAGDIDINVENLNLDNNSFISAFSASAQEGGKITINAQTLDLLNGGKLITATDGEGNGGNINLNITDSINFDSSNTPLDRAEELLGERQFLYDLQEQPSGLYANATEDAEGNGGNINIGQKLDSITQNFNILNNSQILVASEGEGSSGNIFIRSNFLSLNNKAVISAVTQAGNGGNIDLQIVDNLTIENNSLISAEAKRIANGGNIDINAQFIIAPPQQNNDIIASAFEGNGGKINITSKGIFGIEERSLSNLTNDINASSQAGIDGNIAVITNEDNLIQEFKKLPDTLVSATPLKKCSGGKSSLENIGRGGVISNVQEINNSNVWEDLRNIEIKPDKLSQKEIDNLATETEVEPIVEARGWIVNERGNIVLTSRTHAKANVHIDSTAICFLFS